MLFTKSYYRLEEVANRWNCSIEDLLYLAEAGELAIALPQELDGRFYYILNPRDFNKIISSNSADSVEVVLVATTPECARHCLVDKNGNILSDEAIEAMLEEDYQAARRRHERAKKLYFANRTFTADNLVITQEELERFEQENQDKLRSKQDYQSTTSLDIKPTRKVTQRSQRKTDLGTFLYPIAKELERATGEPPDWKELWKEIMFRARASKDTKELQDGTKRVLLDGEVIEIAKGNDSITLHCANHRKVITGETIRNWHRKTYRTYARTILREGFLS